MHNFVVAGSASNDGTYVISAVVAATITLIPADFAASTTAIDSIMVPI